MFFLLFTISFLFFTSCREDTTQLAKDEFSKYYNEKEEVVLFIGAILHFQNNQLNLDTLVDGNEYRGGLIIEKNLLFFAATKDNSMFNTTLNIYQSNYQGTNVKKIFSKSGYKTCPIAYANDGVFYIEHYSNNALDSNSKLIDKNTLSTGSYENIASGKKCNLSDYFQKEQPSRYSIEMIENTSYQKHGKFIVTDSVTETTNIIDDNYLKDTIYIESMEKFNYGPERFDISNGHILLTYGIGAGDGWNFPYLVFEYDFNSNKLDYKLLAFPHDSVSIEIIYIG